MNGVFGPFHDVDISGVCPGAVDHGPDQCPPIRAHSNGWQDRLPVVSPEIVGIPSDHQLGCRPYRSRQSDHSIRPVHHRSNTVEQIVGLDQLVNVRIGSGPLRKESWSGDTDDMAGGPGSSLGHGLHSAGVATGDDCDVGRCESTTHILGGRPVRR